MQNSTSILISLISSFYLSRLGADKNLLLLFVFLNIFLMSYGAWNYYYDEIDFEYMRFITGLLAVGGVVWLGNLATGSVLGPNE